LTKKCQTPVSFTISYVMIMMSTTFTSDENSKSMCPFIFYAQIGPTGVPEALMQELEDELQKPTGVWTVDPPKLSVDGLLMSKECGIIYEVINTEGLRSVTRWQLPSIC
jgi:transmembrane E3 ubiquitin-protein ligase